MKTHRIEIQPIFTGNDDHTNRGSLTLASLPQSLLDGLNKVYESSGVKFSFSNQYVERFSTLLNNRFTVQGQLSHYTNKDQKPPVDKDPNTKARTALAATFPSRLVVYFSFGGELFFNDHLGHWDLRMTSVDSSGWDGLYVSMDQNLPLPTDLAHEIGHYLQLPHTFDNSDRGNPQTVAQARDAIEWFVDDQDHPAEDGLDMFDGDRLSVGDTPPDPRGTIMAIANHGADNADTAKCGPISKIDVSTDVRPKPYTLEPDRSLVMSYFKGCPGQKTFSPHQTSRIRRGLELGIRHRLITLRPDGLQKLVARKSSNSAGAIGDVALAQLEEGRVVTAVSTDSGNLKLIVWDIDENGAAVHRRGDMEAGPARRIHVCGLACHLVVTGHKNADDELELITWRVKDDGSVERLHTDTDDDIDGFAMCRLVIDYTDYVITAVRDDDSDLKLIAWQITPFGRIIRKGDIDAGECDLVSISTMGTNGIMTYVRLTDGKLKGILWDVQSDQIVRLENHFTDKPIDEVAACAMDVDLAASVVRTQGQIQVITWETKEEHLSVNQTADSGNQGYAVGELAACRMGTKLLVTASRDPNNKLKVTLWEVRDKTDTITIRDTDVDETASNIAVCQSGPDVFATAFRDSDGNLKVAAWQVS